MGKCCTFAIIIAPVVVSIFIYGFGIYVAQQISQPIWYRPYVHCSESPFPLLDIHMNPMFEAHRSPYGKNSNPTIDFNLAYDQIEIETDETWNNPRHGSDEIMKMRGWYITPYQIYENKTNVERIIAELFSQGLTREEVDTQFGNFFGKKEGIIGVHGAGVDRRELLRHVPMWMSHGYEVLLVDCRDHGISDGNHRGPSFGLREQHDVATMIKYATEKLKWDNILLFGSSQGGASSLLGVYEFQKTLEKENKTSNISCMIVENAFSEKGKLWKSAIQRVLSGQKFGRSDMSKQSFGIKLLQDYGSKLFPDVVLDAIIEIAHYELGFFPDKSDPIEIVDKIEDVRILYLHGSEDTVVPVDHSACLFEKTKSDKKLELFEGGSHAILSYQFPLEYSTIVKEFLHECHK